MTLSPTWNVTCPPYVQEGWVVRRRGDSQRSDSPIVYNRAIKRKEIRNNSPSFARSLLCRSRHFHPGGRRRPNRRAGCKPIRAHRLTLELSSRSSAFRARGRRSRRPAVPRRRWNGRQAPSSGLRHPACYTRSHPILGRSGETGRRAGLKIPWGSPPVWVQFPPPAPTTLPPTHAPL